MSKNLRFSVGEAVRVLPQLVQNDERVSLIGKEVFIINVDPTHVWPYTISLTENGERYRLLFQDSEFELAKPLTTHALLFRSLDIKLGDKVKINFKPTRAVWEQLCEGSYRWQTAMDEKVGQEGRIIGIVDNNFYRVRFDDKSVFTFAPISVQLTEKATPPELVKLSNDFSATVSMEGVTANDRLFSFSIMDELFNTVDEQKEAAKPKSTRTPQLHLKEDGSVDMNKMAFDALDPKENDRFRIVANLHYMYPNDYTTAMGRYINERYTAERIDEEKGFIRLSNGYSYPALALMKDVSNIPTKTVRLAHGRSAVVTSSSVSVSCQDFRFDAVETLRTVVEKFKALKAEYSE